MKEFRTETMSVKFEFTCVNDDYFNIHYSDYYDFLAYGYTDSKESGSHLKTFYKLKSFNSAIHSRLNMNLYYDLPLYVCASEIY